MAVRKQKLNPGKNRGLKASDIYNDVNKKSENAILELKKEISQSIRLHMERNAINQTDIAKECGLSASDVNRIVNGHVETRSLRLIMSIAGYLKVRQGIFNQAAAA